MPENRELEILMKQKMDNFRLEPVPADWEAIHARLHPKKDRRLFWWWFPLMGALLASGYLYTRQNNDRLVPQENIIHSKSGKAANEKEFTAASESEHADLKNYRPAPETAFPGKSNTLLRQRTFEHSGQNLVENIPAGHSQINPSPENATPTEQHPGDNFNSVHALQFVDNSHTPRPFPETQEGLDPLAITPTTGLVPPASPAAPEAVQKSIPNMAAQPENGWHWGAYAGLGWNDPTAPISLAKSLSADMSSPGNYSARSESSSQNGLHYSAGLLMEKKSKKFSLSFGLGMQHNAWSSSSSIYIDSIQPGSNYASRYNLYTRQSDYSHFALEIPLNFNFRLGGKATSSFWLGTGINNAITIGLTQHTATTSVQQGSDIIRRDSTLTPYVSRYQPQLRLGLVYEHANAKHHWQIAPFLQYGLNQVMKSGQPEVQMLHLELQFRYYISRVR